MRTHYTRTSGGTAHQGDAGAFAWFVRPMTPVRAAVILAGAVVLALALIPFDHRLMHALSPFGGLGSHLGGDVLRELEFLQQFGAVSSVVIVALVVWLNDPQRRTQILGLIAAIAVNSVVMYAAKVVLGRARPRIVPSRASLWISRMTFLTSPSRNRFC